MAFFGAHESISGGIHLAFKRITSAHGEALQIFTRNQRQWKAPPLKQEEIDHFKDAWRTSPNMEVVSHSSYLINLATAKPELREKSANAFILELERCHLLGIGKVVLHPGSHGGTGVDEGLRNFTQALDSVLDRAESETLVLLETTAGQGTGLGASFQELATIIEKSKHPARLGVCFDTCHAFASGYDLRSVDTYIETMEVFDNLVGLENIRLFHLNDSKKPLGSRVDRHDHIGKGLIGTSCFTLLVNDSRFSHLSMILETPKGDDLEEDRQNLALLRSLVRK